MKKPVPYVVDLFCGIGGLTHGFVREKFKVIAGIDYDATCRYSFETNNKAKFIQKDLSTCHSRDISDLYPDGALKILIGCAPCQAFSTLAQKYKQNDKWKLLYSFARIIRDIKPAIISMENVPNLLKYNEGKVLEDFLKTLSDLKYHVTYQIVNAADYKVPQNRNRLILIASQLGPIQLVEPTSRKGRRVTVWDAIGHLPPIKDGETWSGDPMHRSRSLSPLNKRRIRATAVGGGWKDWPNDLLLECHKKESGRTFRSVYGRMKWDDVAPTLTTQCTGLGNGRFGHPDQHRAISLREAAILQSFPERYRLLNPDEQLSIRKLETHIGNAVPVNLGRMIAKSIKKHLLHHGIEIHPKV